MVDEEYCLEGIQCFTDKDPLDVFGRISIVLQLTSSAQGTIPSLFAAC